jgi:hypothetical protein
MPTIILSLAVIVAAAAATPETGAQSSDTPQVENARVETST